jgi:hypothetical protein
MINKSVVVDRLEPAETAWHRQELNDFPYASQESLHKNNKINLPVL